MLGVQLADVSTRCSSHPQGPSLFLYQGKNRKLTLPYHGPFRILEVLPNCLVVKPVDRLDDPAIKVNMDRVTQCSQELPDVSWLGPAKHRKRRSARKGKQL